MLIEVHSYSDFRSFNTVFCSGIPCYIYVGKRGVVVSQSPPGCGSFSDLFFMILTFRFFFCFLIFSCFIIIFCYLYDLDILKNTGQVYYRMALNRDFFLLIIVGLHVVQRKSSEVKCHFVTSCLGCILST